MPEHEPRTPETGYDGDAATAPHPTTSVNVLDESAREALADRAFGDPADLTTRHPAAFARLPAEVQAAMQEHGRVPEAADEPATPASGEAKKATDTLLEGPAGRAPAGHEQGWDRG